MDKDEQIKKLQQENKWLLAGVKWLKRELEELRKEKEILTLSQK